MTDDGDDGDDWWWWPPGRWGRQGLFPCPSSLQRAPRCLDQVCLYFFQVIISVLTKAVLEGDEDGFLQREDLQWVSCWEHFHGWQQVCFYVMMLSTRMVKVMVIFDLVQSRQNVRHLVEHVACALDCWSSVRCLALKNNLWRKDTIVLGITFLGVIFELMVNDQTFVSWKSKVESCLPEQKLHQLASPLRAWMLPSLWRTWGFSIFSLQRLVMIDVVFMSMTGVGMFKYLIKDCYWHHTYVIGHLSPPSPTILRPDLLIVSTCSCADQPPWWFLMQIQL